ncbi:hypothetical protein NDA16_002001 [Ustilago loliicola]|nr:hypothetical protein NDA16_002001 [Ustilago loliicola]
METTTTTRAASPTGTDIKSGSIDQQHSSSEKEPLPVVPSTPPQDAYITGSKFWLVFLSVILTIVLVALDQTIVSTAIPAVTNEFNTFSSVGWYGSAYLLTSTCFQPLFGRLYSRFPIKYTFLTAFTLFELGSLICAVAQDSTTFIVGRAIAGLGMSGAYSGTMIIVTLISPVEKRPVMMSMVGGSYGMGAPNAEGKKESVVSRLFWIDWVGVFLSLCSVICLLLELQWGGIEYAWSDSKVWGLILGFGLIAIVFAIEQWYLGDNAIIPFRLHRQRTVGFGSLVNFCIAAAYFGLLYFVPLYFQTVRGSSAIRSGVQTLPFVIAVIFANAVSGSLISAYGYYIPILILGTALTAIGSGTLYLLRPDSSLSLYVGLQFLVGIGPGLAFMIPFSACQAIFQNDFVKNLGKVHGANVGEIVGHGVSAWREFTPTELLGEVGAAANMAVNKTFLASVALGAAALAGTMGMELNRRILPAAEQAKLAAREEAEAAGTKA